MRRHPAPVISLKLISRKDIKVVGCMLIWLARVHWVNVELDMELDWF
jgi:hypothetical protein